MSLPALGLNDGREVFIKSNAAESNYAGISCDKHLPSVIHLRAGHDRNAMAETKSGIVQSPSKELAYGEQPKPGTTAPRAPVTPDQRTMIAPGRARPAWRIHGPVAESVTDLILPARHDMGRTAKKRTWRHIDCDDEADQIALRSLPSSSLFSVDNEGRPAKKAKAAVVASAKRTSAKDGNRPTGTGHPSASLTELLPAPAKTYDLWMDSPAPVQDPWLSTAPSNGCRKARHRLPPEAIRVGRASASIQCAEPGQSYNPSPAAHAEAVRRAQEAYLEETRDDRRFAAAIQSARQTPTVDECSGTDDDDNEAGTDSIIVGGTAPGRMTRAQRNKRARHLDALRQARRRTAERRLLHQIACLPSKASSVLISKASASKKEGTRTAGSVRRQVRLGPLKQTCSEFPSVLLADDLTGNLRSTVVPSVCNALTQSYVAMQARGYIETRRLAPRPVRRVRLCSRYRHEMDD